VCFCQEFNIGESEHCGVCSVFLIRQISAEEKLMKCALFSAAAGAAIAVAAIAASATSASAAKFGGAGGGGAHFAVGGGGGFAGIRGGGGMAMRPSGTFGMVRPGGTVGVARPGATVVAPQRFGGIRTAQAWNGNRFWDRDRRHFRRGAFFGFAAAYPWWDYGYSDSCWAWNGVEWVYTCYPYPYY
jgi:hypothetical protein